MQNKSGVHLLVILVAIFYVSSIVAAQVDLDSLEDKVEAADQKLGEIQEFSEEDQWEYLSDEWKTILFRSTFVRTLDQVLTAFSPIIFFFFGQPYSFSLTLLFVLILWFFFSYNYEVIFQDYSGLSATVASLSAVLLTIVMAHLGILRFFSELIFKIIFFREGIWAWVSFFLTIVVVIGVSTLITSLGKEAKKHREKMEREQEKFERKLFRVKMKGTEAALDEINRSFRS